MTPNQPIPGVLAVDVAIVADPAGRRALLLQLPNGYILIHRPADVRRLSAVLLDGADRLEHEQKTNP